jgi:hypothetical protein
VHRGPRRLKAVYFQLYWPALLPFVRPPDELPLLELAPLPAPPCELALPPELPAFCEPEFPLELPLTPLPEFSLPASEPDPEPEPVPPWSELQPATIRAVANTSNARFISILLFRNGLIAVMRILCWIRAAY